MGHSEARQQMGVPSRRPDHADRYVALIYTARTRLTALLLATTGGNMIAIQNADDFEFYSSNSAGGIQGHGYQCRNAGYVGPTAERGSDAQFDACT